MLTFTEEEKQAARIIVEDIPFVNYFTRSRVTYLILNINRGVNTQKYKDKLELMRKNIDINSNSFNGFTSSVAMKIALKYDR